MGPDVAERLAALEKFCALTTRDGEVQYLTDKGLVILAGRIEELQEIRPGWKRSDVVEAQVADLPQIKAVQNVRQLHQKNPEESAEVGHIVLEEHMDRRGRWVVGQYGLFLKDHRTVVLKQCSKNLIGGVGWGRHAKARGVGDGISYCGNR